MRAKNPLCFLLIAIAFNILNSEQAVAQTTITAGTLTGSTTWTQANSPYIIQGNVLVASTATLTIQSGVTVKVAGNYFLRVEGAILAVGTASSTITFARAIGSNLKTAITIVPSIRHASTANGRRV